LHQEHLHTIALRPSLDRNARHRQVDEKNACSARFYYT
jgi:hypothetical protein